MTKKTFIYGISTLFFCVACAKMGSISGGPKDETPPIIIESFPQNRSLNFEKKKFEIIFDEFVQLKNANNELIISPPLKNKPSIILKGKSMIVDIKNELAKNTTYTFNFGNAIVDNNEGNILKSYEYVFSTGDYLDSLSISGKLVTAFNHLPEDGSVLVMLYDSISDSIPYLKIPKYIGKTDKNGYFTINNVKDSVYKVFALKDANNNMLFDNPTEKIAFLDTNINLTSKFFLKYEKEIEDSNKIFLDTNILSEKTDTSEVDSLTMIAQHDFYNLKIDLFSFEEYHEKQYITNTSRKNKRFLFLSLNLPIDSSVFCIKPIYFDTQPWCKYEYTANRDTLLCWLTDTSMINCDTLKMSITTLSEDTLGKPIPKTDTINFRFKEKKKIKTRKDKEQIEEKPETLTLSSNIKKGSILDLDRTVSFKSNYPLINIILDSIKLYEFENDTIMKTVRFDIERDSMNFEHFNIKYDWKEETPYMLLLCPKAISGMYNLFNDSILIRFSTQVLSAYGNIILKTENITSPIILLLQNSKEDKIYKKIYLNRDQIINFEYLKLGDYILKAIFDDNDNKKWDTGNYLMKKQAEKVSYFDQTINVRANWDIEQEWKIPNH